jgi:hypothetical protein
MFYSFQTPSSRGVPARGSFLREPRGGSEEWEVVANLAGHCASMGNARKDAFDPFTHSVAFV